VKVFQKLLKPVAGFYLMQLLMKGEWPHFSLFMYDSLPNLVDGGVTIDVDPRFGPDHAEHTIHTISDVRTFGTLAQSKCIAFESVLVLNKQGSHVALSIQATHCLRARADRFWGIDNAY
jgi:hypothetical protein